MFIFFLTDSTFESSVQMSVGWHCLEKWPKLTESIQVHNAFTCDMPLWYRRSSTRQVMHYNITFWYFHVTIVAMETQH
jgi:hypothetical protein